MFVLWTFCRVHADEHPYLILVVEGHGRNSMLRDDPDVKSGRARRQN